jgi:hypothetical protein
MGPRRGEPVRLAGVLTSSWAKFNPHDRKPSEFIGFGPREQAADTMRRVCELVGRSPKCCTLRAGESGRAWTLESA